jgi:2',3'-cyclic-nucleotide 2'-phosphodiesterase (5'-nucleotidase family)
VPCAAGFGIARLGWQDVAGNIFADAAVYPAGSAKKGGGTVAKRSVLVGTMLSGMLLLGPSAQAGDGSVTLIHTGDFHGHLVPRPNLRSDSNGKAEGGLARVATVIKRIRAEKPDSLLLHTGDTIQGSAEVLYTRGDAIVAVLNNFGIDAFAPGNWEFVYGTDRFLELFVGPNRKAKWETVAANVMQTVDGTERHAVQPFIVRNVGNVKIGLLGMTTDRGPQVVGTSVTRGLRFLVNARREGEDASQVDRMVTRYVNELRNVQKVDLLVMLSELGLANNLRIAETIPGIDVILSSDMHEETPVAIVATNKTSGGRTIVVEEGQDGTIMGRLDVVVKDGTVAAWTWLTHTIDSSIPEDPAVAAQIAEIRKPFVSGPGFNANLVNPFNGAKLMRPIDTVVGQTRKPLHRSNFSHEAMPGTIEGSSHDFLTDAFRSVSGAQIGAIRGFRYGTHVAPGPIRMEDLYHYIPIGPQIAVAKISGRQLKGQIEAAADGSLNPDVTKWTGGWLFNFSGVTMDLDPYAETGKRASNLRIEGAEFKPGETPEYTYASYWYKVDPCKVNVIDIIGCTADAASGNVPSNITVVRDKDGNPLDGTEVVVRYLESLPAKTADTQLDRIKLVKPLPAPPPGLKIVQPLRGAAVEPAPIATGSKGP